MSRRINVLHLRDTDRVCGPGKTIIETVLATDRSRFDQKVGLFMPEGDDRNDYYRIATERGVEVLPIRGMNQFDPRILPRILDIVRGHRIDIIHSHEYKSDILTYLVTRLHGMPVMTTVHGWIQNHMKSGLYIKAAQYAMRRFDRVVAVSERTRQSILARGVPASRIVVIHNAIVVRNYHRPDHEAGFLRRRFGVPDGAPIIGYVGRLSPEKGQLDLLKAAVDVTRVHPDAHFVFAGDGPDLESLRLAAAELGIAKQVAFTGHLADVRPVYRDLDVLALTSHTEGFPNVVLEALCMDVPVLATDVGGVSELMRDGVTGTLVPPRDPAAIAAGLIKMLNERQWAANLAAQGRQFVVERFSFEGRVRREEEVYVDLLEEWNRREQRTATAIPTS